MPSEEQRPDAGSRALEGRVALVLGASRGIGAAVTHAYARAGAAVALGARDEEALAAVWLCSDQAAFITGTTLVIDGGKLAGAPPFAMDRGGEPIGEPTNQAQRRVAAQPHGSGTKRATYPRTSRKAET